jgi:hypothetical protein
LIETTERAAVFTVGKREIGAIKYIRNTIFPQVPLGFHRSGFWKTCGFPTFNYTYYFYDANR